MSNVIGVRNNNTIVSYSAATKRTKQIDLSLSCSQGGWTSSYAKGIIYRDSTGNWRLAFNIAGTFTAANLSTLQVSIDNVKPLAIQSISAFFSGATILGTTQSYIETSGTAGRITLLSTASNTNANGIYASGDIALSEEPTTYTTAANMEGVTAVDVYIPPASATESGLINTGTQTFAGAKTFNDAITPSAGVIGVGGSSFPSAGKIGEVLTYIQSGTAALTSGAWASFGAGITLTAGIWHVMYDCYLERNGATVNSLVYHVVSDATPDLSNADNQLLISWSGQDFLPISQSQIVRCTGTSIVTAVGTTIDTTNLRVSAYVTSFTGGPALIKGRLIAVRIA